MKLEDNELVDEFGKLEILKTQNLIDKNFRHEKYSNVDTLEINSKNLTRLLSLKKYDENESAILFHDLKKLIFKINIDDLNIQYSDFENIIHHLIGREKQLTHLSLKLKYTDQSIYHESVDQNTPFFKQITQSMSKTTELSIEFFPNDITNIHYQQLLPSHNKPSEQRSLIYQSSSFKNDQNIIKPTFEVFKDLTYIEFPFDRISDDSFFHHIFQQKSLQTLILWCINSSAYITDKIEQQLNNLLSLQQLSRVHFYLGNKTSKKIILALTEVKSEILQKSNLTNLKFLIKQTGYSNLRSVDFSFLSNLRKLKKLDIDSCSLRIVNLGEALSNNHQQQLTMLKLNVNMDQLSLDQLAQSFNKLTKLKLFMIQFINNKKSVLILGFLFQQMKNLVDLEELSITVNEFCKYEENDLEYLGSSLKLLKNLNKLALVILNKQVNDIQFTKFSEGIKELINLKKLRLEFLEQNCFDEGLSSLAECLGNLMKLKRFHLILNSENIQRRGTLKLQQSIQILKSHQLSSVYLEISDQETQILQTLKQTDQALEPLQKSTKYFNKCQKSFYNKYYFKYKFYKREDTLQNLKKYPNRVTSFNLLIPNILGEINFQGILNGLNTLQNLCKLYLEVEIIGKNGIIAITSFIQTKQLKELSLHISSYKEKEDVNILCEGLKKMNKLDYLSLFVNQDYQDTIQDNNFFESLKSLKILKLIFIQESILRFDSITRLESLNCLWLIYNHLFTFGQFDDFKNELNFLQKFQYLSLCVELNSNTQLMQTEEKRFPLILNGCENLINLVYYSSSYKSFSQNETMKLKKYKRLVTFEKYNC